MTEQDQTSGQSGSSHERIERGAERVKHATSSAAESAHAATDRAESGVRRGTEKVANAAESAADYASEHAGDWMDEARGYVRDKPLQSLVVAVAAGWLVGRLLHR